MIRPKYLVECHSIIQLIQAGTSLPHLSKQVVVIVYEMLINCFVLPWNNVTNQDFDKRNLVLQEYVNCLAQDFMSLDSNIANSTIATVNCQESKMLTIATSTLPILKEVVEYFKDSSSAVKHMLTDAFKVRMGYLWKALNVSNIFFSIRSLLSLSHCRCLATTEVPVSI